MSTHCILAEPSLQMHPRKGREGKGRGREGGPKAPSMTSGRGWPSTGRDHHQAVSASVMDVGFAESDGGVR